MLLIARLLSLMPSRLDYTSGSGRLDNREDVPCGVAPAEGGGAGRIGRLRMLFPVEAGDI